MMEWKVRKSWRLGLEDMLSKHVWRMETVMLVLPCLARIFWQHSMAVGF